MKNISQNASSNVSCILVGNKTDLQDQRQVSSGMGHSLAARYSMRYFETSALDGLGVEGAFDGIVFEHLVRHLPASSNVQVGNAPASASSDSYAQTNSSREQPQSHPEV